MSEEQNKQLQDAIDRIDNIVLYEFGVYRGASINLIKRLAYSLQKNVHKIYGFDSFKGLPEEKESINRLPCFGPGAFKIEGDVKDIKEEISRDTGEKFLIAGFYSDSLIKSKIENEIGEQLELANLVYIDCDLYISTYQALDFMFSNKLIQKGAIIAYDEFDSVENGGEQRAHYEICEKYNVDVEEVFCVNGVFRMPNFMVKDYGLTTSS